jgi:hypothetical protein
MEKAHPIEMAAEVAVPPVLLFLLFLSVMEGLST